MGRKGSVWLARDNVYQQQVKQSSSSLKDQAKLIRHVFRSTASREILVMCASFEKRSGVKLPAHFLHIYEASVSASDVLLILLGILLMSDM